MGLKVNFVPRVPSQDGGDDDVEAGGGGGSPPHHQPSTTTDYTQMQVSPAEDNQRKVVGSHRISVVPQPTSHPNEETIPIKSPFTSTTEFIGRGGLIQLPSKEDMCRLLEKKEIIDKYSKQVGDYKVLFLTPWLLKGEISVPLTVAELTLSSLSIGCCK